MKKFVMAALAVAAATTATSAVAFDRAYSRVLTTAYDAGDLRRALAGDGPVEIIGAPVDAQAVADALDTPAYLGRPNFVALSPTPETRKRDRLVLVFGGAAGGDACKGEASAGGRRDVLYAAVCFGDDTVTEARLISDTLTNPTTGAFTSAARQLIRYMAPRTNPLVTGGDQRRRY